MNKSNQGGLLEKVMKYSLDMICVVDADCRLIQVSEACKTILGYERVELIGRSYLDLVHPDDLEVTRAISRSIMDGEKITDFENRFRHKSGRWVPISWSAHWSEEDQNMFSVARDATQLHLEKELGLQKEAFYEALVEHGSDMLAVLDINGNYTFIGDAIIKALGYTRDELLYKNALALIHPDDLSRVQGLLQSLRETNKLEASDYRYKTAKGEWRWLETVGSNQLDNPAVRGFVVNSRDVTERKQAQFKLKESEQLYKSLFENNPDPILLESKEKTILAVNKAHLDLTGLKESDVLHRHFKDIMSPEEAQSNDLHLKQALSGEVVSFRQEVVMPNGEMRVLDKNKFPVIVEDEVVAVYSIAKDVTPMVRAYETIQKQAARKKAILESIRDAFFTLDKDWCLTYINSEFEKLFQVKEESVIGKNFWAITAKFLEPGLYQHFLKGLETGEAIDFEVDCKHLNKWLNIKVYPSEEGLSVYLSDVSKQKQIERHEALSKKVLELNVAPGSSLEEVLSFYLIELEAQHPGMIASVLYAEDGKLYTLCAPSLPLEYIEAINGVNIGPYVGSCGAAAFTKEKVIVSDIEHDVRWQDFKEVALKSDLKACWSLPILGANQKVLGTLGMYHKEIRIPTPEEESAIEKAKDLLQLIIENKRTEAALKLSNERYDIVTSATSDIIWDLDLINNKIYWGKGVEVLLGDDTLEPGDSTEWWSQHIHSEDREEVMASFYKALQDPEVLYFHEEYRFCKSDEQIIHIEDRAKILRDKEKKPFRMIGALQDVTERKKFEEERENLIIELQERNQSLQQFTQIVSHNLRAPVANILGLTALFKRHNLEEHLKQSIIEKLLSSSETLDTVIKDLNHILSLKGKIGGIKEPVMFEEILGKVLQPLQHEIESNNVHLTSDFQLAPTLFTVRSYLYSIMHNLISNAIKYRKQDQEAIIEVRTYLQGENIILSVKDNGIGFDAEKQQKKIFGLYNRFHTHIEGRGVGLFLVKAHAEALGGKVTVQSKEQEGSTFEVCFRQ